jgi:hypothetical protein
MATPEAAEAARALNRQRWGSTRAERLLTELEQSREQLTDPALRARVAALAEPTEQEEDR